MRRWRGPAGLAEQYGKKVHVVLANPFEFFDAVYEKVEATVEREDLAGLANLSFHRVATHPLVDRRGAAVAPGWNSSGAEVAANELHGVWTLFDKRGNLAFHGRAPLAEIEERVAKLVRGR